MQVKMFEIRDHGTFIPAIAIKLGATCEAERYLLARAGYGRTAADQSAYVLLGKVDGDSIHGKSLTYDPYGWGDRTMTTAHNYIVSNFDRLETGAVVDVQFLLKETTDPKISEALVGVPS